MSDKDKAPTLTGKAFETASATLAAKQATALQDSTAELIDQMMAQTASIETPVVTAGIHATLNSQNNPNAETILALREVERKLRAARYPDSERATVQVSNGATIHHDFRRKVSIPDYVKFPTRALVNGKPLLVGTIKIAPVISRRTGEVVKAGYELPIYAAADDDGNPLRDASGEYVVIDPQTGAIRQRVRTQRVVAPKRSWLRTKWDNFVYWLTRAR